METGNRQINSFEKKNICSFKTTKKSYKTVKIKLYKNFIQSV